MSCRKDPSPPSSGSGASAPCDSSVQSCPLQCPPDFILTAPPCRIIKANGGSVRMSVSELPGFPAGTYAWTTASTRIRLVNPNSSTVTVEGLATPSASRDAETITVTRTATGCPPIVKTVNVTVAAVDKIAVKVKATPALTARAGAVAPADHDFDCAETAEAFPAAKSLVLIRGDMQEVELQATVRPADAPMWWDVRRASDDHASLGGATDLPTLTVDGADHSKAKLRLDNKGAFFVRVFTDCDGSHNFDPGSAFRLLPTVLVDVTLHADNTVASAGSFAASVAGGNVRINTGSFNIANVRSGVDTAAIYMNAAVDVKSGGPDGRRLLDCVFAGWINNLRSTIRSGQYAGAHVSQLVLATNRAAATGAGNTFNPGDPAPVPPTMPVLDSGRSPHGIGGETATLTQSRALNADKVNQAVGQRWRVEAVDSPGGGQGLGHPNFPGALNRVHHEDNFTAFLGFWTNRGKTAGATADPSNRVYAAIRTYQWRVLGEWTVGAAPGFALTVATAPSVTTSAVSTISPAREAHRANCEVRAPNIFDLLAVDARM